MKQSIHFSLAPGKASDLPIRMRISYDGYRLDLRTGFVCPPDKWDSTIMRVKAGAVNRYGQKASAINRSLSKEEATLCDIMARYDIDGLVPEPAVLKADFEKAMGRKSSRKSQQDFGPTFLDLFRTFLDRYPSVASLSSATIRGYSSLLKRLEDFAFVEKSPEQLTVQDLSEFINEMRDDGIENQSVHVYLSKIKTFLRWARSEGYYHGRLPEEFCPKLKGLGQKDVHYLDWSDFELILNVELDSDFKVAVRDAFCFCCATGLRVSDCQKLRWEDLHLDSDKSTAVAVVTKKTKKPVVIELNKWSRMILDRYRNADGSVPSGLVFPPVSITCRNDLLPKIAKCAGVKGQVRDMSFVGNDCRITIVDKADSITTHWARHTFIVHALSLGISPIVVMAWTGHASYESLKPYIAIADKTKAEKMELFDE